MNTMFLDCCNCAAQFVKLASSLESPTNCEDVWIVAIVCITVVSVIGIASCGLLDWQDKRYDYQNKIDEKKNENEENKKQNDFVRKLLERCFELEENERKYEKQKTETAEKEKNKTDYQKAGEFFKQVCDATKDKEGKLDDLALETLITFFREEWRKPEQAEGEKCTDMSGNNKENVSQNGQKDS